VKLVGLVIPLRPSAEDEMTGLDISQHGEEAYLPASGSDRMTA
jgi:ammonia channel protein AmtB